MSKRNAWTVMRAILADQSSILDRELLRRFADEGDQVAFAALFRRHAPLVLGVCRRALQSVQDAEDACQVVFLVLAKKAKSNQWRPSIANWLYVTARKTAANLRVAARRRAKREGRAGTKTGDDLVEQVSSRELLVALDMELERLPSNYREPLVSLLFGRSHASDQAARRLEIPLSTLKIRLERGKKRLAAALSKRGCGLGAGLLLLATASTVDAAHSRLLESVLAALSGSPNLTVAALAEKLALKLTIKHSVLAMMAVSGMLALSVGAVALVGNSSAESAEAPRIQAAAAPQSEPVPITKVDVYGDALPPQALARIGSTRFQSGTFSHMLGCSPDGGKLALIGVSNFHSSVELTILDSASGRLLERRRQNAPAQHFGKLVWLPDSRGFALVGNHKKDPLVWEFTDRQSVLPEVVPDLDDGSTLPAISPDGKWIAGADPAEPDQKQGAVWIRKLIPNSPSRSGAVRWRSGTLYAFDALLFTPDSGRLIGIARHRQDRPNLGNASIDVDAVEVFVWNAISGEKISSFV